VTRLSDMLPAGVTGKDLTEARQVFFGELDDIESGVLDGIGASEKVLVAKIQRAFDRFLDKLELSKAGTILDTAQNRELLASLRRLCESELRLHLLAKGSTLTQKALSEAYMAAKTRASVGLDGVILDIRATDARYLTAYNRLSHQYLSALTSQTANHIRSVLTQGHMVGLTPRKVANLIVEGGHLKAGKVHTVMTRAELWARTEPMRVAQEQMLREHEAATGEDNPHGQWVAFKDARTGGDSLRRHGVVLTRAQWLTRRFAGDKFVGLPPIRPNDRCDVEWLDPRDYTENQWARLLASTPARPALWYNML